MSAAARLEAWLRALLDPTMPGMDDASPRARPVAYLLMAAALAAQVWLRYRHGFLPGKEWQAVHILIGLALVLGIFVAFHGVAPLRRVDRRSWGLYAFGVLAFVVFWYVGRMDSWERWFAPRVAAEGRWVPLHSFAYFSLSAVFWRLVLPFGAAWAFLRLRPGALGLYTPGNPHPPAVRRIWPVYLLLYLVVLPSLVQVAGTEAFQRKYPMCRQMIGADGVIALDHLIAYEALYVLIFVSGEALWRGILTFSLERGLGVYALIVMCVPYVTAHFGKPLPETLGAIAAGTTLGWLALKHRSVWLGVALHYAVALTMDLLAIRANGFTVGPPP